MCATACWTQLVPTTGGITVHQWQSTSDNSPVQLFGTPTAGERQSQPAGAAAGEERGVHAGAGAAAAPEPWLCFSAAGHQQGEARFGLPAGSTWVLADGESSPFLKVNGLLLGAALCFGFHSCDCLYTTYSPFRGCCNVLARRLSPVCYNAVEVCQEMAAACWPEGFRQYSVQHQAVDIYELAA